ncbi:MAG: alginate export family protein [Planctomycetota bacterium]
MSQLLHRAHASALSLALLTAGSAVAQEASPQISMPGVRKLTIGGQYRLRYENRYNYDFDSDATRSDDFFVQRLRLNLDFDLGDDLRVFAQLQEARAFGSEQGPNGQYTVTAADSPGLDFHQAFVDVRDVPLLGGELRAGRQILSYGAQRFLGALEWANQGRSFDGLRQRWEEEGVYRVDAFLTQTRETPEQAFEEDAYFGGVYGTHNLDGGEAELYVLHRHDDELGLGGVENRLSIGGRYLQRFGSVEVEAEAVTQTGEDSGADIPIFETYGVHAHVKLFLGEADEAWIRGDFDAGSGDDPDTADNERFDTLYPTGHGILGIMDFVFLDNLVHTSISAGLEIDTRTDAQVQFHAFRSNEATDRVVGPVGKLSDGGPGVSRDLGYEIDAIYTVRFDTGAAKTSLQIGYGIYFPGPGVEDSLGGDDLAHFAYAQGNVVF